MCYAYIFSVVSVVISHNNSNFLAIIFFKDDTMSSPFNCCGKKPPVRQGNGIAINQDPSIRTDGTFADTRDSKAEIDNVRNLPKEPNQDGDMFEVKHTQEDHLNIAVM